MKAEEFVKLFYKEKDNIMSLYFDNLESTQVGSKIRELDLNASQLEKLKQLIDDILKETIYGILLGIDGEASIGGIQQTYKLYDEAGCEISSYGDIEKYAYEYFMIESE